jgi:hypothetical protein
MAFRRLDDGEGWMVDRNMTSSIFNGSSRLPERHPRSVRAFSSVDGSGACLPAAADWSGAR